MPINKGCFVKGHKVSKVLGKNNINWNNGSSFEPYSLEFNDTLRETIRSRDDYDRKKWIGYYQNKIRGIC